MRRVTAAVILMALFTNLGCSTVVDIPPEEVEPSDEKVLTATYRTGKMVKFKEDVVRMTDGTRMRTSSREKTHYGVYVAETRTIDGLAEDGSTVSIPVDSLSALSVRRNDDLLTILAVLGITAGVVLAITLIAIAVDPPTFF